MFKNFNCGYKVLTKYRYPPVWVNDVPKFLVYMFNWRL